LFAPSLPSRGFGFWANERSSFLLVPKAQVENHQKETFFSEQNPEKKVVFTLTSNFMG
jgi:hypothetical protein